MNTTRSHVAALAAPLFTSCAAMFGAGPFDIPVASNPPGATVRYGGRDVGTTPCVVRMDNGHPVASLHLANYHPQEFDVGTEANTGLVLLGMLVWGPLEFWMDGVSGAFRGLNDSPVYVDLTPTAEPPPLTWRRAFIVPQ